MKYQIWGMMLVSSTKEPSVSPVYNLGPFYEFVIASVYILITGIGKGSMVKFERGGPRGSWLHLRQSMRYQRQLT